MIWSYSNNRTLSGHLSSFAFEMAFEAPFVLGGLRWKFCARGVNRTYSKYTILAGHLSSNSSEIRMMVNSDFWLAEVSKNGMKPCG